MKQKLRMLATLLGSVWFLCLATPAHAVAIFDFDINFTIGTYSGNTYSGSLTTSSSADGEYDPLGSLDGTLLAFDITIEGYAFSIDDDTLYPTYPIVGIQGMDIYSIDYYADLNGLGDIFLGIELRTTAEDNQVILDNDDDIYTIGVIANTRCVEGCTVPEPGTLALLGVGLAGMGFTRRVKKTQPVSQ